MKIIMVDLDGTLIDTKEVNFFAYKEALEENGFSIDYDFFCEFCNGKHYLDFLPQITTRDENILKDIHDRKKEVYSKYLKNAVVNQGLVEILKRCRKDYKIVLVTTASKENTKEILENFQLLKLFDSIITREDITKPKPDPEGYYKAMEYYKANPEECIIFEDSDVGIEAAKQTGATIFVAKGYN